MGKWRLPERVPLTDTEWVRLLRGDGLDDGTEDGGMALPPCCGEISELRGAIGLLLEGSDVWYTGFKVAFKVAANSHDLKREDFPELWKIKDFLDAREAEFSGR